MAIVIGVCVGTSVFIHLQRSESTEERLVQTSKDLNARLPMNLDSETRWDTTVPGPGNCLTYCYTLIHVSKSEIDPGEVAAKSKARNFVELQDEPRHESF